MTTKAIKFAVAILTVALTCSATAAIVGGYESRGAVTNYIVYPEYGGGDVTFQTETPIAGCEAGFWLRPTDPGFKNAYAVVLTSYTTKSPVRVWAHDDSLWPGSSGRWCRVYAMGGM